MVLTAGCGSSNPVGGGTPDTTAPTVLSTNPINGSTGVAVINVSFSEPMLVSSIGPASFTVKGPGATAVAGTVAYDADNMRASFVPSDELAAGTYFTASVTTAARDRSGNSMANDYLWNFSTAAAATTQPTVVLASSADYAVLAGSTISNTGTTQVTGDMGLSPGPSVTGFPPGILVGAQHVGDPSAAATLKSTKRSAAKVSMTTWTTMMAMMTITAMMVRSRLLRANSLAC